MKTKIDYSIRAAVDYLSGCQEPDGCWHDYKLPVGSSDQWVTAFIGLCLVKIGETGLHENALSVAKRAAHWLIEHKTYEAGWGYNGITGPDVDSTGNALALLKAFNFKMNPADQRWLRKQWKSEGGFATYTDCSGGWAVDHPDVIWPAFSVLDREDMLQLREEAITYLQRTRLADGMWPAYWWNQGFYSTFQALTMLKSIGVEIKELAVSTEVKSYEIRTWFDAAFALGVLKMWEADQPVMNSLISKILDNQKSNGSWTGGRALRVTNPDYDQPWKQTQGNTSFGELYQDVFNCVTTASMARILAMFVV